MKIFIKKYWLKFTNKKKYQEYKSSLNLKNEIENYKKNLEGYIKKIQEKITDKKELSFLHSGTSGDVINSLPIIKELSKTHKCNLYIQVNKPYNKEHPNHFSSVLLSKKTFNMLVPLLKSQQYISTLEEYHNQEIDINFDIFRDLPISIQFDNLRYYFHVAGIQPNILEPYLEVGKHEKISSKIVIHRTSRYRNHFINYKFLENYENLFFVGTKDEYEDLKKDVKNLKFYDCKDHLEMAMIIKASKFFIGNSSIGHGIAEGLKIPRLLEACPYFPAALPHGNNAYDFYFQIHFEKFFKKLHQKQL